MNKVIFYNGYHVGDIVLSKPFVREIMKFFPNSEFYYAHNNNKFITSDLCRYIYSANIPINDNEFIKTIDNTTIINSWFGNTRKVIDPLYKFEYHMYQWNYLFDKYGYKINLDYMDKDPINFVWEIEDIYINNILTIRNGFNVLIYNLKSLSGQADYIDATPIIEKLADKFKNVNFYITNGQSTKSNIICLESYFTKQGIDLFQFAELSKKCKIVTGNCSGPIEFGWIKSNLFDKNKTYIVNHKFNSWECMYSIHQLLNVIRVKSSLEIYTTLERKLNELQ
jgi:hypothetical protein